MPTILEDNDVMIVTEDGEKIPERAYAKKSSVSSLFPSLSFKRRASSHKLLPKTSLSGHKLSVGEQHRISATSAPIQLITPNSKRRRSGGKNYI